LGHQVIHNFADAEQRRVRITSKVAPWIIIDFMLTQPLSHTRQLYFDKLQRFNEFESFGIDTNSFQIAQTNKHTHMLNGLNAAVGQRGLIALGRVIIVAVTKQHSQQILQNQQIGIFKWNSTKWDQIQS